MEVRDLYLDILNYVDFCLTQFRTELIATILRIQKKTDITYKLIYVIVNDFFEDKNKTAYLSFQERINSNFYVRASLDLPPDEKFLRHYLIFSSNTCAINGHLCSFKND